jgi:hypothetical protein
MLNDDLICHILEIGIKRRIISIQKFKKINNIFRFHCNLYEKLLGYTIMAKYLKNCRSKLYAH